MAVPNGGLAGAVAHRAECRAHRQGLAFDCTATDSSDQTAEPAHPNGLSVAAANETVFFSSSFSSCCSVSGSNGDRSSSSCQSNRLNCGHTCANDSGALGAI